MLRKEVALANRTTQRRRLIIDAVKKRYQTLRQQMHDQLSVNDQMKVNKDYFTSALKVIYEHVIAQYPEYKDHLGVYYFGSNARGQAPLNSDIDFFVVIKAKKPGDPIARQIYQELTQMALAAGIEKQQDMKYFYVLNEQSVEANQALNQKTGISWNRFINPVVDISIQNFDSPTGLIDRILVAGPDLLKEELNINRDKMNVYFFNATDDQLRSLKKPAKPRNPLIKERFQRPLNVLAWAQKLGLIEADLSKESKQIIFIRQYLSYYVQSGDIFNEESIKHFLSKASPALKAEFETLFGTNNYSEIIGYLEGPLTQKLEGLLNQLNQNCFTKGSDQLLRYQISAWSHFYDNKKGFFGTDENKKRLFLLKVSEKYQKAIDENDMATFKKLDSTLAQMMHTPNHKVTALIKNFMEEGR